MAYGSGEIGCLSTRTTSTCCHVPRKLRNHPIDQQVGEMGSVSDQIPPIRWV